MNLASRSLRWQVTRLTRPYGTKSRPAPRVNALKAPAKSKPNVAQKYELRDSETLTLSDSRTLGFSTYGPANAPALLVFHGFPGSRLDVVGLLSERLGARVIGIDRPGMGLSTFQNNRRLLDWPQDVLQLVDYLGIRSFRVLGGSAGGPYALACAKAIPKERLRAVGVASGFAPAEAGLADMSREEQMFLDNPTLFKLSTWWRIGSKVNHKDPRVRRTLLEKMAREMGVGDRDISESLLQILAEPWRQGVSGYVEDALVLQRPWGFDLTDVDASSILLWYGEKDDNTPVAMGHYMAERLKGSTLRTYPDDDHFTLMATKGDKIIQQLMGTGR